MTGHGAANVIWPGLQNWADPWQWLFSVGGAPTLLAFALRRGLPELPRWLAQKGRHAEADAIVTAMERDAEARTGGAARHRRRHHDRVADANPRDGGATSTTSPDGSAPSTSGRLALRA